MAILQGCEPMRVFRCFEEISRIPHGSGNEKELSDYLTEFAKVRGLWVTQDNEFNVIIKKPGSPGHEGSPAVIIQAHIDMVCEKNTATSHDFLKDPLILKLEGDYISASGTTLGADNGIAVAYALALLDDDTLEHPPLEIVLTTNEETGMNGAEYLDTSPLVGKLLINIDNETEGEFISSCAGGLKADVHLPARFQQQPSGFVVYDLELKGLKGGHSGMEIHKERANANRLMARALSILSDKFTIYLANLNGGLKDNAIPREARAVISVMEPDGVLDGVKHIEEMFRREFRESDPCITLSLNPSAADVKNVFTSDTLQKIITVILLIPNGVQSMSTDIPGLVESSNNLGVVTVVDDEIIFSSAVRSSVISRKNLIKEQIARVASAVEGKTTVRAEYPAWEYNPDSPLRRLCAEAYQSIFNREPTISAIHAGLECGLFAKKISDVDIIALGPDIFDAHTPDEKVSISSIARTWYFLLEILRRL